MKFQDLNDYCLIEIFEMCGRRELKSLSDTCYRFKRIADKIMAKRSAVTMMSGHKAFLNISRAFYRLPFYERLRIGENWAIGRYKESVHFPHSSYPSKICLERPFLYMSHRGCIRVYKRCVKYIVDSRHLKEISSYEKCSITDFVKKDETIFAGRNNGSCFINEGNDDVVEQWLHPDQECITSVDFKDNTFVTSTHKKTSVWSRDREFNMVYLDKCYDLSESFKCLKISNDRQTFIAGKFMDRDRRALLEVNIETKQKNVLNSQAMSILDIILKDDNIVFTANSYWAFHMFDRRTNRDESIWEDPYTAEMNTLAYDGQYGVLCGMKGYCRINLYDIRVPRYCAQMYIPRDHDHSHIHSLTCDSSYMFITTDYNLRILNFETKWGVVKDFAYILKHWF